ncbi:MULTISPECIES: hypothetical protein [unclassified Cupriavidus]|uniref:hypothetical protein n=1 Tax=Cupriavidus sp. H19C3 TaxID=3241603 RepID=UPI003BF8B4A4
MPRHTNTTFDPDFAKQLVVATRLVNMYEETFKDLLCIAKGCRKLFHEMGDSDDERYEKGRLLEIVAGLDRAMDVLKE